jgi:hypothetical protein
LLELLSGQFRSRPTVLKQLVPSGERQQRLLRQGGAAKLAGAPTDLAPIKTARRDHGGDGATSNVSLPDIDAEGELHSASQ